MKESVAVDDHRAGLGVPAALADPEADQVSAVAYAAAELWRTPAGALAAVPGPSHGDAVLDLLNGGADVPAVGVVEQYVEAAPVERYEGRSGVTTPTP